MNTSPVVKSLKDIDKLTRRTLEQYAEEFGVKFTAGIAAIREAGRLYAEALRKYPTKATAYFNERYPGVGAHTWEILGRIGNGDLNPSAIYLSYEVAKRVSRLPIEKQDKMFATGVKGFRVVDPVTNRFTIVPLTAMRPKEAALLIDETRGCVRTVEEQRAVIEQGRKADAGRMIVDKRTKSPVPYAILGGIVRIGKVELGLETLRNIVAEVESNLGIRR